RRLVLVQADQSAARQEVHGVVKVRIGVLVDHRLRFEERPVPRNADRQVSDRKGDVCKRWKWHQLCPFFGLAERCGRPYASWDYTRTISPSRVHSDGVSLGTPMAKYCAAPP